MTSSSATPGAPFNSGPTIPSQAIGRETFGWEARQAGRFTPTPEPEPEAIRAPWHSAALTVALPADGFVAVVRYDLRSGVVAGFVRPEQKDWPARQPVGH